MKSMKNRILLKKMLTAVTVMVVTLMIGCDHPLEEVTPEAESENKKELCMGCVKVKRDSGGNKVVNK